MIIYVYNVSYGYQTYNIDNLWLGLSQMGNVDVDQETN